MGLFPKKPKATYRKCVVCSCTATHKLVCCLGNLYIHLAGFAPQGTALHAELYLGNALLAQADTLSGADGMFTIELPGQPGSYDEYRILVSSASQPVAALERVVFGELWLAGGQSNMAWQYAIAPEGIAEIKAGYVPERPWIRML